ncbi:sensor histidine kinase [Kineosporia succinea]|uniref:histidine kinase n=1 Tax=Kineosporia succinea TaxID=84632 RepID=A0ABT9P521_9ACTN|nr:ATP-binding protein [Kineosporia succinea]MDP9827786.1 signal transduction histidine kinase [Kineosporia succinea]
MSVVPTGRDGLLAGIAAVRPGPGGVHLTQLCRQIRSGLGVARVRLVLSDGREFAWPAEPSPHRPRWTALTAGREKVGEIGVEQGYLPFGRRRRRLLSEVAGLLGPLLRGAQLQSEIDRSLESARGHAERVAAVRRRAFGERDAERRQIERDLHDGAQHHLVALGMTLGLLELHAANDDVPGQRKQLLRLRNGLDRAENALFITATGGSPLLQDAGVQPALLAEFRDAGSQVRFDVSEWDAARRYEALVELAVYFICLEAVNNARKHAPEAQVTVRLSDSPAGLTFSVTDTGPGADPRHLHEGSSGMANMRRRMVAAGGRLQVRSAPGAGTTVLGFIPF